MLGIKHFVGVVGSGDTSTPEAATKAAEEFMNRDNINTMEVNHSYQHFPHRVLSIMVMYAQMDNKQKKAIKEGVKKAEETAKKKPGPKKKTKAKKKKK